MAVYIDEDKCKGCAVCVPACPVQAISMRGDKAVIDHDQCTECLECLNECPLNAIYQVIKKENSLVEKPPSEPVPVQRTSLESSRTLEKQAEERKPLWKDRGIWEKVLGIVGDLLQNVSTSGGGKGGGRGGGGRHRGRRKGYRGGRGRH